MNIGFDLDGVLMEQTAYVSQCVSEEKAVKYYISEQKPNFNPAMFLAEDDMAVIITARQSCLADLTRKQCAKFFPGIPLVHLFCNVTIHGWEQEAIRLKAKALKDYDISVYFEDNPTIVEGLRQRLRDECIIVQYGGRLKW